MKKPAFFFILFALFFCQDNKQQVQEYWDNEQPKIVKRTTYDGDLYTFFDKNGKKEKEGLMAVGRKEKLWTYYYESGSPNAKITYRDDKKFGPAQTFFPNGQLKSEGHYNEFEKEQGVWIYYHKNGEVSKTGTFENGKKEGVWKNLNPSGDSTLKQIYLNPGQLLETRKYEEDQILVKKRYSSGVPKAEGETDLKGYKTGKWTFYHENGQKNSEGFYKQGKKTGFWEYWYPNGQLMATGHYLHNVGQKISIQKSRQKKIYELPLDSYEQNGIKMGKWRYWSMNGSLKAELNFEIDEQVQSTTIVFIN